MLQQQPGPGGCCFPWQAGAPRQRLHRPVRGRAAPGKPPGAGIFSWAQAPATLEGQLGSQRARSPPRAAPRALSPRPDPSPSCHPRPLPPGRGGGPPGSAVSPTLSCGAWDPIRGSLWVWIGLSQAGRFTISNPGPPSP